MPQSLVVVIITTFSLCENVRPRVKLAGGEDVCVKVSGVKAADVKTSGHRFYSLRVLDPLDGTLFESVFSLNYRKL